MSGGQTLNTSSHLLFTISSESNTCNIWDYTTGNLLRVYRSSQNTQIRKYRQLGYDYFIATDQNKPLLHVWPINKQEEIKDIRMILPKPARALAISPDNGYLTLAIDTKLYTWEISTGFLLSVVEKHLQPVTCLEFAGYYLISASEGGSVVTFAHSELISTRVRHLGEIEPRYIRNDHTGPITDLHVGSFDIRSRFVTVSIDCTAIVYEAVSGVSLFKLVLNSALSSVVADNLFSNLFIGTESGKIIKYFLHDVPRTFTHHIASSGTGELSFIGHKKRINCLNVHMNDDCLISGSDDNFVYIWNITTGLILNAIDLKGPVSSAKFISHHENIYRENFRHKYQLKSLRRAICNGKHDDIIIVNR